MAIGDRIGDMADKAIDKAGGADKVKDQIGNAADRADSATGGRLRGAVDKGEDAAKSAVDKFSKKNKRKNKGS
ncbi:MAG: antitoxin [Micromonosporaceae bacterium]|nr:antitoxin [Micromonosporaceae bacterium]